jgi:hypothetical protein
MNAFKDKFIPWLMSLTTIMRYLVIAILVHAGLIAVLATIKIAAEIPKIIAAFDPDSASPPPPSEAEPDPTAAFRDFEYNGPTLGGGGGTPGKGPGGIPTAAGNTPTEYKAAILSDQRSEEPVVGEVVGVVVDAASAFRPQGTPGGIAAPTTGLGAALTGTAGVKGPGGGGFGQRQGPIRSQIVSKTRRGAETERAVLAGLRWLQSQQNENGSWNGVPSGWHSDTSQPAITALAVLAFLGHGETPESREFGNTVLKGLQYLVGCIDENGVVRGKNMYSQGAVTLALAEGYGMTQSVALKSTLERAINAIQRMQKIPKKQSRDIGGWRYTPTSTDSDTSVSGWMIMALKSAKLAEINVSDESLNSASAYIWRMYANGIFGYTEPGKPLSIATTGIGVLCQQYLGHGGDERIKKSLDILAKEKVDWLNVKALHPIYAWYYINQAMFQAGGTYWRDWNINMSDSLLKSQAPDGHWDIAAGANREFEWGEKGHVYSTAMACLMLEVYYRYLPLYQQRGDKH